MSADKTINEILRGTREDSRFTMATSDVKQQVLAKVLYLIGEDVYSKTKPGYKDVFADNINRVLAGQRKAAEEMFK